MRSPASAWACSCGPGGYLGRCALPRQRLGLHVLLFVVYQKVALGLSYSKLQHELRTYFGLSVSAGELPSMLAEIAAMFGPAYARLL